MNQQECDKRKKHYLGIMAILFGIMAVAVAVLYITETDGSMLARLAALAMLVCPITLIYYIAAYFQCKPTKKSSISDYPIKHATTSLHPEHEQVTDENFTIGEEILDVRGSIDYCVITFENGSLKCYGELEHGGAFCIYGSSLKLNEEDKKRLARMLDERSKRENYVKIYIG